MCFHDLKNEYKKYTNQFIAALNKYDYRVYDIHYKLNDNDIYCSELPFLAFRDITGQNLGKLVKLGALNWKPYEATIVKYEHGSVPLEREMITPKGLSEAEQLYHVQSIGI